jgi:PRKCA-binding protein
MRADVLVKLELLDQKHGESQRSTLKHHSFDCFLLVQDIVFQLHRFITALDKYHKDCNEVMKEADIFPIEVDLTLPTLRGIVNDEQDDNDDETEQNNDEDLFGDDQHEITSRQQRTNDAVLLNID